MNHTPEAYRARAARRAARAAAFHARMRAAGKLPAQEDHSSHEDRECGDRAFEDACADACGL